jgi:hypothetical protein
MLSAMFNSEQTVLDDGQMMAALLVSLELLLISRRRGGLYAINL